MALRPEDIAPPMRPGPKLNPSIYPNLAAEMQRLNLGYSELSRMTGIEVSRLSPCLRGKVRHGVKLMVRVSTALGFGDHYEWLFDLPETEVK